MVSVFSDFGIHISANDENVVFVEGDELRFFTNIGMAAAGDYCCSGIAIKIATIILGCAI